MSFVPSMVGIDWDQEQYERDLLHGLLPETPEEAFDRQRLREERLHLHDLPRTTMRALRVPSGITDRCLAAPTPASPPWSVGAAVPTREAA